MKGSDARRDWRSYLQKKSFFCYIEWARLAGYLQNSKLIIHNIIFIYLPIFGNSFVRTRC